MQIIARNRPRTMTQRNSTLVADVFHSFRELPTWVQIWVALILVPMNLAAFAFWSEPMGPTVALLALLGMLPNLYIMIKDRGFTRRMAIPHLPFWTALIVLIALNRPEGGAAYQTFLNALLVINTISLVFDYKDAWDLWKNR